MALHVVRMSVACPSNRVSATVPEARCRNMERQLTAKRAAAGAGRVTARALARSEAAYNGNRG